MNARLSIALALLAAGCGYVSKADFEERRDVDQDGLAAEGFENDGDPFDCNDGDPNVGGSRVWLRDEDKDGYGPTELSVFSCEAPEGYVAPDETDCDDLDARRFPGNVEVCDGVDNDCNRVTDEDLTATLYLDLDGDGAGLSTSGSKQCLDAEGWVVDGTDCDDSATTGPVRFNGNPEICDGIDNDCDTEIDDGLAKVRQYPDGDGDGHGDEDSLGVEHCEGLVLAGFVVDNTDCDDELATVFVGADERCDGVDTNCDRTLPADESDTDGDGYVECDFSAEAWSGPPNVIGSDDCGPTNRFANPDAVEVCDNADNNCDGAIDEEGGEITYQSWYVDLDGDDFGTGDGESRCSDPGVGYASVGGDCDDDHLTVFPGAKVERCDGVDTDCDGTVAVEEEDGDGDGYIGCLRDAAGWFDGPLPPYAADCDNAEAKAFPTNPEVCDGIDNDCVGGVDSPLTQVLWFIDADLDGYGDRFQAPTSNCGIALAGRVNNSGDCDDEDPDIHLGAEERCFLDEAMTKVDEVDSDCDGRTNDDDAIDATPYYRDRDGDKFGDKSDVQYDCAPDPLAGRVRDNTDCDDNDVDGELRYPGQIETCNNYDSDCDGVVDDNPVAPFPSGNLYYFDYDLDGFGDDGVRSCTLGGGYVEPAGDCRDDNPVVHPGAPELPSDGIDGDCDGDADGSGMSAAIVVSGVTSAAGRLGSQVAKAGNGRLLVSAPAHNSGAGAVYLLDVPTASDAVTALARTTFVGRPGAQLQTRGDSGVDLTGDGEPDFVLVDYRGDDSVVIVPGPVPVGTVDPFATGTGTICPTPSAPTCPIVIASTSAHPLLRVEPVPSLTADQHADLLVSTQLGPGATSAFTCNSTTLYRGSVNLFDGPFVPGTSRTIAQKFASMEGISVEHWTGTPYFIDSLSILGGTGDVNGDGRDDVAFGAPWGPPVANSADWCTAAGRVIIVLGPIFSGAMTPSLVVSGNPDGQYGDYSKFGSAVSLRHDVSGDGRVDLLVGATGVPDQNYGPPGALYAVSGTTLFPTQGSPLTGTRAIGTLEHSAYFDSTRSAFGAMFDLGDIDGDGTLEWIGNARTAGRASLLGGYSPTRPSLYWPGQRTVASNDLLTWTHGSVIDRSVIVPADGAACGAVAHGSGASLSGDGAVYVFPGSAIYAACQ